MACTWGLQQRWAEWNGALQEGLGCGWRCLLAWAPAACALLGLECKGTSRPAVPPRALKADLRGSWAKSWGSGPLVSPPLCGDLQ